MVTMQQIADRCGVSRGTVDRALHHKEGVREEVAERIRAAAREMGYISNRLVMQQTQQWKIGVVLHSGHSPFVQMLCELFESFSERALIPNITVIVRAMQDMDVQHQLTLIDELVTTEHIDGLALMPLANTLVRDKINTLSEKRGIPVVTFNTDITDANRIAYVGADNIATGRAAAALLGMVIKYAEVTLSIRYREKDEKGREGDGLKASDLRGTPRGGRKRTLPAAFFWKCCERKAGAGPRGIL